jgi:hypothetical protein
MRSTEISGLVLFGLIIIFFAIVSTCEISDFDYLEEQAKELKMCPLHKLEMSLVDIPIVYGLIRYYPESSKLRGRYFTQKRLNFPFAPDSCYEGGCVVKRKKTVSLRSCPKCCELSDRWLLNYYPSQDVEEDVSSAIAAKKYRFRSISGPDITNEKAVPGVPEWNKEMSDKYVAEPIRYRFPRKCSDMKTFDKSKIEYFSKYNALLLTKLRDEYDIIDKVRKGN